MELIKFVRVKSGRLKGQARAVIVAVGPNQIGWAQANVKAGDKFNKVKGISIARTRAVNGPPKGAKVPHDVAKALPNMELRATKCFKSTELPESSLLDFGSGA
jgi:hypothetical protein